MYSSSDIHQQAEKAREEERYSDALSLYRQALLLYQKEGNYLKIIELHCGEALTYKHLFESTKDIVYLILTRQCIATASLIADKYNVHSLDHMISFYSGEINLIDHKLNEAAQSFEQALREFEKQEPENVVNIARYRYHFGHALCLNQEKDKGITQMKQALHEIKEGRGSLPEGIDGDYVYNVHVSGCLMTLALDLYGTNKVESKKYLDKARVIIESDLRLSIRKKQLTDIEKKLQ